MIHILTQKRQLLNRHTVNGGLLGKGEKPEEWITLRQDFNLKTLLNSEA